jgi:hypothetical protein
VQAVPGAAGRAGRGAGAGPAACGYDDQCWTLARIAEEAWQRFGAEYTLAGMDVLLHRIGWSVQVPVPSNPSRAVVSATSVTGRSPKSLVKRAVRNTYLRSLAASLSTSSATSIVFSASEKYELGCLPDWTHSMNS